MEYQEVELETKERTRIRFKADESSHLRKDDLMPFVSCPEWYLAGSELLLSNTVIE